MKKYIMLLAVLLTGCASLISGGVQPVQINSSPPDVTVEIFDKSTGTCVLKSQTPCIASLKSGSGYFKAAEYTIRFSKPGYIPQEDSIKTSISGWYWGNILFGGVIGLFIVDPATGAMWKFSEHPAYAMLDEVLITQTSTDPLPEAAGTKP